MEELVCIKQALHGQGEGRLKENTSINQVLCSSLRKLFVSL